MKDFSFLIAAALLSTFIFWLMIEEKYADRIRNKIDVTLSRRKLWGIFFLVFISVLREGIETVIFLRSLITYQRGIFLPIMGALAGFIFALLAGILIYFSGRRMPLKSFFLVTNLILIFFAAGMVAYGVHELGEAGLLPSIIEHVYDINPPVREEGVYPLLHENGALGGILKGLLGYNGNPSLLELIAYVFYLAAAITVWLINKIYQKRKRIVK